MRRAFWVVPLFILCLTASGAVAQAPPSPDASARAIQEACVRRGEDARVCACNVGLAFAKLSPRAFALLPQIDPLIDEPDRGKQIGGLVALAGRSGMTIQDLQSAYETIRANRTNAAQICKPLAPARAGRK